MEDLIKFETAKLAKKKGLNVKTIYHYPKLSEKQSICLNTDWNHFTDMSGNSKYFSAPTQSILQKWLRENSNLNVVVDITDHPDGCIYYFKVYHNLKIVNFAFSENNYKETYEEALEKGLIEALKLI